MTASAYDAKIDGIYYNLDKNAKTAEVTYGDSRYYRSLTIPDTISFEDNIYKVTSVGKSACNGCFELYSLTIGNNVTTIGEEAFHGCEISSVTIGNSVKTIGNGAFQFCERLGSVDLPNSVTSIGDYAFHNCERLSILTIGNGLTSIGKYAFCCRRLESIVVDNDNKKYDSRDNCNAIIETASNTLILGCAETTIPNSVKTIGDNAFSGCWNLTSFTIPNNITSIGDYAFSGCSYLVSITIPNGVTSIGKEAFYDCLALSSIDIPASVVSIGEYAFYGCKGLSSINLSDGLKSLGNFAFQNCDAIGSVHIPNSVTAIGKGAFSGCYNLTEITLPNSLACINDSVFSGCQALTSITLPNGVTSIGNEAFSWCNGLTTITIPNNVTSIGDQVFEGCEHLTSVTIPKSVSTLGYRVFERCSGLTNMQVESGNPSYDSRDNCNAIIETASNTLLYGCMNTQVPNSVTTIGYEAFSSCSGLTAITLPNGITNIGHSAFDGCYALTSINLPEKLKSIGNCAFRDCSSLTSIIIPEGVTTIGEGAFQGCSSLTSITSLILEPFDFSWTVFSGVDKWATILYVPGRLIEKYKSTSWSSFNHIMGIPDMTLKLVCMVENKDISSDVTIEWRDTKGEIIGNGQTIGCFAGQHLHYSIYLNEDMGHLYHEIVDEPITVGEDSVLICHLQKIENLDIFGRVSTEDIDKKTVTVHVKQMINGKYEEKFDTQTNSKGEFSLEGYDDDTEIIISCDGYADAVVHRTSFNGNGDLGVITLKPITGFVAPVNINFRTVSSEDSGANSDLLPGGLYDLELTLRNESTGSDITDFSVQYNGTLIIHSGVNAWNRVSITAKSKKQFFADATTDYYADEEGNSVIELNFVELGGVSATYSESGNSGTAGYLYDSNGNLVEKGIYNGETLQLKHAPEGSYTLISIGQSALLSNISSLSKIIELNLAEGKDYLRNQLEINNGEITEVSVGNIPKLNESLFLFDGSLLADKSSVVVGRYVTLYPKVNIDEELYKKVNDVYLTIDIPDGCELIDNTVFVDRKEQIYTKDGNTLSLHLTKEQAQGDIALCVVPVEAKAYNFTAYVSFDKEITSSRPLGLVQVEGEALTLRVPSTTPYKTVIVSGIASSNSEVKIYDGDVKIGETTSKEDGTWSTQCELYNAYNLSCHDLIAKVKTQEGRTFTSGMKSVEYDRECIVPSSVSMTFYNGWHDENITVDFDLMNGTTSKKHYDFYEETDFTFLAKFTKNDPELIDDVNFMVKASDGTIRILPALFDSKQQAWVATSRYNYDKLPQNVTVDYVCLREETDEEREESINELGKQMAAIANHIYNFIEDKVKMEVIEEDESSALLNFESSEPNAYYKYRIEKILYSEAETMMKNCQFSYMETEEGGLGTYTEVTDYSIIIVFVDLGEKEAFRITFSDPYMYAKKRSKSRINIKGFLSDLGDSFVDGLEDILGLADFAQANNDFDMMRKRLKRFENKYAEKRQFTFNNILAKCPDGTFRLTQQQRGRFSNEMQTSIWPLENKLIERYNTYLETYKNKLGWSVATFVGTLGLGKYLKSAKFVNSKLNKAFQKTLVKGTSLEESAETLGSMLGQVSSKAIDEIDKVFSYQDFQGVRDECKKKTSRENKKILNKYADLNERIMQTYSSCRKEKNATDGKQETFNENNDDNTITFTTPPVEPILDPSGFVYEAVLSNRLPGVTTTVYQKQGSSAVKWNAENYSQQNPLVTDEAGFYRWDVPQGEWQVKYEKDGYETCYSEWLPVPPPQLDVNVGMKQTTPPTVKQMRGMESGITIEMSKYMLPAGMNKENITVKKEGSTMNGKVEMMDNEQSPTADDVFVSKVKFVPDNAFYAGDEVYVTVKGNVESYCGVAMGADHTQKVVIEPEITAIVIDSVLTIPYGGTKTVEVLVMPKEVSAGKTLNARLSSNLITSLDNEHITIDENGLATLTLNGDLPGGAQLTLTMDNTDVSAQSRIKVDVEYEVASTPTSSIRNGEQVGKGTLLTLECATEGATIYYTLDGSCPCNEDTRIRYTGPFALPEGVVTVKAVAVAEYLYDSDVATFIYQVSSQTGIDTPTAESTSFKAAYHNGAIVIDDAEGAECQVYDMAGRELNAKKQLQAHDALPVTKTDTYVVYLKWGNGKTAVRKIARR